MPNPIQIKADPEFVNLIRKMKLDAYKKNGIRLSDPSITRLISKKMNNCSWDMEVGKWRIRLK